MNFENESSEKEFGNLIIILDKLKGQYSLYKEILVKQRNAIVTNNIEELTELLLKIENANENIERLEGRCAHNVDILAMSAGLESKTIRDIVKAFPQFNSKKLENAALELKKVVQEVKNISATNAELLEISKSIIKETMSTIMTQNVDPRDRAWRTYGNNGGYSRTVRREPVHLVNKQG
ncbi:MAG: flagellar protein FlgN [Fibromonadaceae bacterium]|jgi:DNA repair exonuclease SbcCD ATPase subunit|nr:flagellar protein FlgN [Fibromonadaceae bacterium]